MLFEITLLALLVFLSALSSASETALITLNNVRVRSLMRQKRRGSEALNRIKKNPHRLLVTILICNNFANIAAAAVATELFTLLFGFSGVGIAAGVMTFVILMFGDIIPKTVATSHATGISLIIARPVELLSKALIPIVGFFEMISTAVTKLIGSKHDDELSEEEIRTIVTMGKDEGILTKEAAEMMHNLLVFRGSVKEIMTPKKDIEYVNGNSKLRDIIDFVVKCQFTRYPVYMKDRNNIIGILDEGDVLKYAKDGKLSLKVKSAVRPVLFVPETKDINEMLSEFESSRIPMGVVVNEYSEVSGILTVEDILEEIVGNIFIKSRRKADYVKKVHDRLFRVEGDALVQDVNRTLNLSLDAGGYNTMAGFIEHHLKKIPKSGERLELENIVIQVDEVTPAGIKSVNILKK